jgi:5'-3' exonuclease
MANKKDPNLNIDNNTVLFVDGNYLAFKSFYPVENLAVAKKRFLRATYRLKQKTNASVVTVSFDHEEKGSYRYEYS